LRPGASRRDPIPNERPIVRVKSDLVTIEEKLLPAISAAAAAGRGAKLKGYIRRALSEGVPLRHVEEVILQCYLFAGFPAALEGLVVLREATAGRRRGRPGAPSTPVGEITERGLKLCRRVYGDKYEPLRRRSLELHPEIWDWMIREGYGKVLSRPPLRPPMRELCVIATLVVTGWSRQLRSHLHGALNVGCTREAVMGAVRAAGRVAGPECHRWAREVAESEISAAARRRDGTRRDATRRAGAHDARRHGRPNARATGRTSEGLPRLRRWRSRDE
jgi:alkylhydroperoxidase/carboxymuconolactone decarboxylase family protein YurZ